MHYMVNIRSFGVLQDSAVKLPTGEEHTVYNASAAGILPRLPKWKMKMVVPNTKFSIQTDAGRNNEGFPRTGTVSRKGKQ